MFKILKIKLMMMLATVAVVGSLSVRSLPLFNSLSTANDEPHNSNIKEEYKSNVDLLSNEELSGDSQDNNVNAQENNVSDSEYSTNTNEEVTSSYSSQEEVVETQSNANETPEVHAPTFYYDRTTSIYEDDMVTLLRVEYYVNNKLTYYSEIEQFDAATKSYIEKIYKCDLETNNDPLIRTDVYVNGNLVSSY